MMGNGTMNTTEANVHRISYTTPRDRMADAAALLMRDPSQHVPALIAALDAIKGRGNTMTITDMLNKEASK